jgi:serine/threonine protein kinase
MPPRPGQRIGPYEIVTAIGAGGMGEVYRARDTKLGREVALKILPEALATNADRLARLRREAQLLASLNHPNIAHVYGLEDAAASAALVMELVEGSTLDELLRNGRLPREEALAIARQIADALETAHEAGIIHRDLKPANVKVREDGMVKVLDFGLAKALDSERGGLPDPALSPAIATMTSPALTAMGIVLGTAAYMAPEQAKGKTIDKRADIWAFGCVLWEMLTGRALFARDTMPETIAAVIKDAPPMDALPSNTPPPVRRLLERCLERDPRLRLRDIGEARILLASPRSRSPASPASLSGV